MQNIYDWAGANSPQRKIVEGKRILEAGHIVKCRINVETSTSGIVSSTAADRQTSQLREKPHEMNRKVIMDGKIKNCVPSCKPGLGEKYKHIIATLLYCYR